MILASSLKNEIDQFISVVKVSLQVKGAYLRYVKFQISPLF